MITIIDYGVGNLGSILNMFKKIGVPAQLTKSKEDILSAEKILLPGVGAFDYGMKMLNESGYLEALEQKVLHQNTPILGICLGLQLMSKKSEEGLLKGLGWLDAETVKFELDTNSYKIPHMGWNDVHAKRDNPLFRDMYDDARFYFVHSYHIKSFNTSEVIFTSTYGYEFVCGLQKGNIYGAQFHPEKSHKYGMKLLKNFAEFC